MTTAPAAPAATTTPTASTASTSNAAPSAAPASDTASAGANAPASATTEQPAAPASAEADAGASNNAAAPTDGSADNKSTDPEAAATDGDKSEDAGESQGDDQSSDGDKPDGEDQEGEGEEGQIEAAAYEQAAEKVTLPEGMEIDKVALTAAIPFFQKYKVPPEEAVNAMAPIAAQMISKSLKQQADRHEQQVQGWYDQTVATHGKAGEADFENKVLVANRAIKKFMSESDRAVLKEQGLGNLPGLFTMAYEIGLQMGEDGSGSAPGVGGAGDETLASVWYGNKKQD